MHITVEVKGDVCILRLDGRFVTGSDAAYTRAKEELAATGCHKVVVDCRETPYLDSTGLAFVVGLYGKLQDWGGHFVLANVNPRIREVLEISGLDDIFAVFDDEMTALAALDDPELRQSAASAGR